MLLLPQPYVRNRTAYPLGSSSNWGGTAAGAAIGGVLVAQFGFGTLSYFLVGVILGSGLLMTFLVNDTAVARARKHFSNRLEREGR